MTLLGVVGKKRMEERSKEMQHVRHCVKGGKRHKETTNYSTTSKQQESLRICCRIHTRRAGHCALLPFLGPERGGESRSGCLSVCEFDHLTVALLSGSAALPGAVIGGAIRYPIVLRTIAPSFLGDGRVFRFDRFVTQNPPEKSRKLNYDPEIRLQLTIPS